MNSVDVAVRGVRPPRWRAGLEALCRRALSAAGIDGWDLSVLLTGDEVIRGLNGRYRGRNRPTDVLSFAQAGGRRVPGQARVAATQQELDRVLQQIRDHEKYQQLVAAVAQRRHSPPETPAM